LAEIPVAARHGVTTTRANVPEVETVCPECGKPVSAQWRFCPSCEEPLWRRGRERSIEMDVRRDSTFVTVCMILLAGLAGVGITLLFFVGAVVPAAIPIALLVLFISGIAASLSVVFRKDKLSTGRKIGLAAFRSLSFAGLLFLVFFAGLIVFVVACTAIHGDLNLH